MSPTDYTTLYQTPVHGVFVTGNGALRTGPVSGDRPRPFGELLQRLKDVPAGSATINAGGTPIRILSDGGSDPDLAEYLGIAKDIADTIKLAAAAISTVSAVGAAIVVVIDALEWLGLFGSEPNPYDELYNRIKADLANNLRATLTGTTALTMQNVATAVAHSVTAGQIVGEYLSKRTAQREAQLPNADYWSRYAMNTLSEEAYWLRTYDASTSPLPANTAMPDWEFGPVTKANLIWDWRLTLPAYLKALTARLAVVRVLDPLGTGTYRAELLGYARHLQLLESRIRGGFSRSIARPDPGYPYWMITTMDACGVIDVHGGFSDMTSAFTPAYWWQDPIDTAIAKAHPVPTTYEEYSRWYDESVGKRYWRLYDALGLFALWQVIPDVQDAAIVRNRIEEGPRLSDLLLGGVTHINARTKVKLSAFKQGAEQRAARRNAEEWDDSNSIHVTKSTSKVPARP